jgi:hypothetical protein
MAKDKGMYALTQFKVAVINETTLGTANTTSMQLVNIDGYPSVNRGTERFLDLRHGDGTVAKNSDVYISQYGKVKEISFTALYDQTLADIFIENCIGRAETAAVPGVSPAYYGIPYNYTGVECATGDADTDYTGAMTVALISPEGSHTEIFPGCFTDQIKIYADAASDGGRLKMDVTLKTRHNISFDQAAPTGLVAYPSTYRTIHDLATTQKILSNDVVINKFELTINSQVKFYGCGANGIPDTIGRGIPEMIVTGVFGIKYDANTAGLIGDINDENTIDIVLSNSAAWDDTVTFGLKGDNAQISDNFNPADVEGGAFIDLPVKFLASTTGNVFEIVP